jgi:hypothetical protein
MVIRGSDVDPPRLSLWIRASAVFSGAMC